MEPTGKERGKDMGEKAGLRVSLTIKRRHVKEASADCFIKRTHVQRNRVPVKGVRKVWGTLRSTTAIAVENTLRTPTNINAKGLVVKWKLKTACNDSGQVVKWWFVVRGEESVLEQLQKEWPTMSIQRKARLHPSSN